MSALRVDIVGITGDDVIGFQLFVVDIVLFGYYSFIFVGEGMILDELFLGGFCGVSLSR